MMDDKKTALIGASSEIGNHLAGMAAQAISDKTWIEDRWLADIRQLQDCDRDVNDTTDANKHTHNITKPKTLTAEARISDMLFQSGDKNFAITPDVDKEPERAEQLEAGAEQVEKNIINLLDECQYEHVGRMVIKFGCELGVGVLKGPVKQVTAEKNWIQVDGGEGQVVNILQLKHKETTAVEFVNSWDYFPDMGPADHKDCAFEIQRHWLNKTDIQKLIERGDFNNEELINLIETETPADQPRHLIELRDSALPAPRSEHYILFECYARIPSSMLKKLCEGEDQENSWNHFDADDINGPDFDVEVVAWVSESGRLLKLCPNQLETDERPFSVFCYDRDTSCFMASPGIPRLVKIPQRDTNSAWQRINDNSDLSVGPQWIVDPAVVEPIPVRGKVGEDNWNMTANKGWRLKRAGADATKAFHFFNVPSGVQENMLILQTALQFADVETQLPEIASGEQSERMTKTFSGMELLINASNTVQRRIIKDWDDNITIPLISRLIDDQMQNNPIPGVYGSFVPNAQGTASLLLKETSARNSMNLSQVAGANPQFAGLTDWVGLYKEVVKGLQCDPDKVIKTDDELQQEAAQEQPPSPESIKAQAELQAAQADMLAAQNDQQKLQATIADMQAKRANEQRDLIFRANKSEAELKLAYAKLGIDQERDKIKVASDIHKEVVKGEAKKEEIKMQAKARESNIAAEYLVEKTGQARI